jgi:hypothetical protein
MDSDRFGSTVSDDEHDRLSKKNNGTLTPLKQNCKKIDAAKLRLAKLRDKKCMWFDLSTAPSDFERLK